MFTKFLSYQEVNDILDNRLQNHMAADFIMKYLRACKRRNKKYLNSIKSQEEENMAGKNITQAWVRPTAE